MRLKAPYVYFGGKSKTADIVWQRFGKVNRYIEPFFGSGAVLLANPNWDDTFEIVNDLDHFIANCWRAIRNAPDEVAYWCDYPVVEIELHLWHFWLVTEGRERIRACEWDDKHYDAEVAGKWLYGMANWIGSGFASGKGGWTKEAFRFAQECNYDLREVRKRLDKKDGDSNESGVSRGLPYLSRSGQGIYRKRPHLSNSGQGISRQRPHLGDGGRGIKRKSLVDNANETKDEFDDNVVCGLFPKSIGLYQYIRQLAERFAHVKVCCGDWSRVVQPAVLSGNEGITAILFDPPYSKEAGRDEIYTVEDFSVAHKVREWCLNNGWNPRLRIALCGYDVEHGELEKRGWVGVKWKANGGYSNCGKTKPNTNRFREVIWFSPHCLDGVEEPMLF